ncbi:MAG: hypothetical protein C7B45_05845 [Sulfobacillus acidophilus]|uniref:Fructose-bisphosphate aldolase n=1 Tax=Sulfobacillus acidophilus TaxID=53633 RepID=A0A2T2WKE8_9FIRM|nr:MAG: hypothetical protein C7B45_05845 [Sulfobacillus acidophilus]
MSGWEYRMGRIFQSDGRTVILPVDHGVTLGHVVGLQDPASTVENLLMSSPDAILLNRGLARVAGKSLNHLRAPARILNVDNVFLNDDSLVHESIASIQAAVVEGYDAVKTLLPWDGTIRERMDSCRLVSELIDESRQWQIPIIVEPTFLRESHPVGKSLSDCVRVAFELGADILKIPYPGSLEVLGQWVESFKVPLVLLGGPDAGSDEAVLHFVKQSMSIGVKGVAIGRKVWQRPMPEARDFMRELVSVVHGNL